MYLSTETSHCLLSHFFRQSKQNNTYEKVDLLYFLHIKEATVDLQGILDQNEFSMMILVLRVKNDRLGHSRDKIGRKWDRGATYV